MTFDDNNVNITATFIDYIALQAGCEATYSNDDDDPALFSPAY